ncbi:NAD(P)/FAD-dependent oxidoreductase [bacterium]|nr:NAD(P)/FAD-dependent oxidoreductase [bacterium]MBU1063580.1 NAD(P)/FAD-dependent oxidoreductase [bacterium]MBU1634683.1 NAD(P)/FAD-dependent oxidoreductase [bacterium]MBU1872286.1 NAD(P)/FAD-dependent oxidoreductase [bacterium]
MINQNKYDVIVIGGGPAGIMAAGQAALRGKKVLLLEKMERLGRKLRITGKGRCNLTNDTTIDDFIYHFGKNGRFLKPALYSFFVNDLRELLAQNGIATIVERGNRIFPECESAPLVTEALIRWLEKTGSKIKTGSAVSRLNIIDRKIVGVESLQSNGKEYFPTDAVILATGGKSYPRTGSTGDGYKLALEAGHKIINIRPALIPLETTGNTARQLQGLSLKNVSASLWKDGKKQAEEFGEMLFAHFGLTGPIILTLSGQAVDALDQKSIVEISIDLKPALDYQKLDARLLRDFGEHSKQQFQTILKSLLPSSLIPICIDLTEIPSEKIVSDITSKERQTLRNWLKDLQFNIIGYRPIEEAIITAGGIDVKEIQSKTMESRLVSGLFFAGEVIDIDADTGGYNLQAAFSTGFLAGISANKNI